MPFNMCRHAAPRMRERGYGRIVNMTSAAGFIADFCGAGGQVAKRVFPPLNTTDYS